MRHLALVLALGAAACGGRREPTQVVTPVRLDTARITVAPVPAAERPYLTTDDDPFARLDRLDNPGPNIYRAANGAPGPAYWQNRADYDIQATLDTAAKAIRGTLVVRYTNNSPHPLDYVWMHLDQNLYRQGSKGSLLNPVGTRWSAGGFVGGYDLSNVSVNGTAVNPYVNETVMRLDVPGTPIPPNGGTARISMTFSFPVPERGSDRMARDSSLYQIAQWYPRMAVFDDVTGWNVDPYLGQGEFYLEYGDYTYAITAPAGYVVTGTGMLQNAAEVLTAEQRRRLELAMKSDTVVQVITAAEAAPRARAGTRTWRFRAENVRDVAWAAAPDFRWDATSWKGILTQALYPWPRAGRGWEDAAENTQWAIKTYSDLIYTYPYPQATSVAGPVGGMEYPMFVFVHTAAEPQGAFRVIDHEHGHQWFPMVVGSNERRFAWMDEGLDTYINAFSSERRTPGRSAWPGLIASWRQVAESGLEVPLMTPPDRIARTALGALGYRKPAAVLFTLRNHVVGPAAFDEAFRAYVERWAFKHPTPADFFRTIEDVAGEDLDWFWRSFFYTTDKLDIGVGGAITEGAGADRVAVIDLERHTDVPFPVTLRLRLANGQTRDVRLPVQIWNRGDRYQARIPVDQPVTGVRVFPDPTVPDWEPANNVWGNAPPADEMPLISVERGGEG